MEKACHDERSFVKDLTNTVNNKAKKEQDDLFIIEIDILRRILSVESKINVFYSFDTAYIIKLKINTFIVNFDKTFKKIKKDFLKKSRSLKNCKMVSYYE